MACSSCSTSYLCNLSLSSSQQQQQQQRAASIHQRMQRQARLARCPASASTSCSSSWRPVHSITGPFWSVTGRQRGRPCAAHDPAAPRRQRDVDQAQGLRQAHQPAGQARGQQHRAPLCQLGWVPDLIIASNSKRTKQTLDAMAEAAAELGQVDAHFLGSLYTVAALDGQTKHHLEETIRSVACDAANSCVMCVGHNKGWEEAAARLRARRCGWAPRARRCSRWWAARGTT
ncbi:hypothetical protein COO60DRAFT_1029764 [Scenedesmus sp. NREL 46B-D3]|nr:hypothetical protein COO60DRAFT_1029764 [Scenedesmus sp. NREL 46B-D3]